MAKKAKKQTCNTGLRNRNLFCFNCCVAFPMPKLPAPVKDMTSMMTNFVELHKNCEPTWKVPEPDMNTSEFERGAWWTKHGEHGTSSQTMWCVLAERKLFDEHYKEVILSPSQFTHPSDPDDFRRCYLLLKAVPEWRLKLDKLKTLSQIWFKLVENWDKLTEMLEEQMKTGKQNGMYELMESLTK